MSDTPYRIGIDLGGTKIEAVLLGPDLAEVRRERTPSPAALGYEAMRAACAAQVAAMAAHVPKGAACTVGVGIPGSINARTGLVQNANSTCLIGHAFQADLEADLGRAVAMRNDADCFTLAECRAGAGQGYGLVFGVIMGTGCGGGICVDGVVRQGPHGIAGEWGHVSVDPLGPPCYCGKRGCVETLISGSGVERAFYGATGRRLAMRDIVAGAATGDAACARAMDRFLEDFGRCLGGLISVLDPDAVVLGGGLSNIDALYGAGLERVRRYAFHGDLRTPVLRHRLGDAAGVLGAAWIGI
ncbi:MAG: ROK family protein [Desulfovibrionaceae bacterium]